MLIEWLVVLHRIKMFHRNLKIYTLIFEKKTIIQFVFVPVDPVAGVVDVFALPNAVVLPNGRIVVEFCKPVPNVSGCDVAGAAVDALAVGLPNVNVEFNAEGAAVPAAGVGVEPKRNPVVAGAAPVVVDVAPKAIKNKKMINEMKSLRKHTI